MAILSELQLRIKRGASKTRKRGTGLVERPETVTARSIRARPEAMLVRALEFPTFPDWNRECRSASVGQAVPLPARA